MYISFSSVTYTGHKFSTHFYIFHLNFYKSIAYKYTESLECLHITTEENKTRAERTLLKDQICFGCAAAAAAKSLQSCPTVWPHRRQPTWLPRPWDSPGKNTGVGCHFLLQCMKVKSEREVAQSCLTLSDPMDCSPPASSAHGIFQARVLEWGAIAFSKRSA